MKNTTYGLTTGAAIIMTLAGCGGGSGSNGGSPAFMSAAEGNWIQNCRLDPDDGDFVQDTLVITDNDFVVTERSFSDSACTDKQQEAVISGTFIEGDTVAIAGRGNATEIDLTINQLSIAFFTPALIENANGVALCGSTTWAAGVSMDVGNCNQVAESEVPRQAFDIYLRDNDTLTLGTESADSAAMRPVTLDDTSMYTLVSPDNGDMGDTGSSGNSGGPTSSNVSVPQTALPLSASNGVDVARFTMSQFDIVKGLTNAGNIGVLSGTGNSDARVTELFISSTCEGGGTANINGTPALLSTLTATYGNCVIDGTTYNGSMAITFNAANGPIGDSTESWSFSAPVRLDDFSVNTGERQLSIDGDFILTSLYLVAPGQPSRVTSRFQGIMDEVMLFNETDHVTQMTDFDYVFTFVADSPAIYTDSFDEATLASSIVGGIVIVESASDLGGFDFSNPEFGELEITGDAGSRVVIEALGSDAATISIDADGNGEFSDADDLIETGTWSGYFGL